MLVMLSRPLCSAMSFADRVHGNLVDLNIAQGQHRGSAPAVRRSRGRRGGAERQDQEEEERLGERGETSQVSAGTEEEEWIMDGQ